jgi:hypothetical protein
MLTDLSPGGQSGQRNVGGVQGIPDSFFFGINTAEFVKKNFRYENGKFQVLKEGKWVDG